MSGDYTLATKGSITDVAIGSASRMEIKIVNWRFDDVRRCGWRVSTSEGEPSSGRRGSDSEGIVFVSVW